MKKNLLAFILFTTCSIAAAQKPEFSVVCSAPHAGAVLKSWQSKEGAVYFWNAPIHASITEGLRSLWIEKIENIDHISDTQSVLLTPTLTGRTAVPYCIIMTGNKLYALMLVKIDDVTDHVFADEIEPHDLSLNHKPFKIFEYKHTSSLRPLEMAYMDSYFGYLSIVQSEDRSKTMFYVNECLRQFKTPNVYHSVGFDNGFSNALWERKDSSLHFNNVTLGNNGTAVLSRVFPVATLSNNLKKGHKEMKSLIFLTIINEKSTTRKEIYVADYTMSDLKTVVTQDNKIILAGFYFNGKISFSPDGIFYMAFNSPEEDYSVKKGIGLKENLPADASLNYFELKNVLVSANGMVWVIGEHRFGINSHDNYGNLLIAAFNDKGDFQSVQMVNKHLDLTYTGASYTTFSAQVYKDHLLCFFNDDKLGFAYADVSPDGKNQTVTIKSFDKKDIQPIQNAFYTTPVENGSVFLTCTPEHGDYSPHICRVKL